MLRTLLIATLALAACGETSVEPDAFACGIRDLGGGTWRWVYTETSGDCGPVDPGVAVSSGEIRPPDDCDVNSYQVSSSECSVDMDVVCSEDDAAIQWVVGLDRVAPGLIEGTGTIEIVDAAGTCRSGYEITVTKL